jgi:hypothetical protein
MLLLQKRQVLHLVAPQIRQHILVVEHIQDLGRLLLELHSPLHHLLLLLAVLLGDVVEVVHLLV